MALIDDIGMERVKSVHTQVSLLKETCFNHRVCTTALDLKTKHATLFETRRNLHSRVCFNMLYKETILLLTVQLCLFMHLMCVELGRIPLTIKYVVMWFSGRYG
jgi:hypothetical protein